MNCGKVRNILYSLLLCCCSCNGPADVPAAKPVTAEAIRQWLREKGFADEPVLCTNEQSSLTYRLQYSQAPLLFDNNTGNYLAFGYTDGEYDAHDAEATLTNLVPYALLEKKPDSILVVETSVTQNNIHTGKKITSSLADTISPRLHSFLQQLYTPDGLHASKLNWPSGDYTLFLQFALAAGKGLPTADLRKYMDAASGNRRSKINVVLLNLDQQAWW